MGVSESMYVDGDIPRKTYDILLGPGWAYYKSCENGVCCGCDIITDRWLVNIKMSGRWVCDKCKSDNKYPMGRGL